MNHSTSAKKRWTLRVIYMFLAVALALLAVPAAPISANGNTPTPIAHTVIGPAGGSLVVGNGQLVVSFPAGAVKQRTLVTFTLLGQGKGQNRHLAFSLNAYQNGGEIHKFNKNLTISASYKKLKIQDGSNLQIVWLAPDGSIVPLSGGNDPASQRVYGETDHFSDFAIVDGRH